MCFDLKGLAMPLFPFPCPIDDVAFIFSIIFYVYVRWFLLLLLLLLDVCDLKKKSSSRATQGFRNEENLDQLHPFKEDAAVFYMFTCAFSLPRECLFECDCLRACVRVLYAQ